jgi:hypothetical protein
MYGLLYLGLVALVAFAFVDGGGGGSAVPALTGYVPLSLEVRGAVTVMTAADGSVAFLGRVRNPNRAHVATSFTYAFHVTEGGEVILETPLRTGFVYPGETTTLLETFPSVTITEGMTVTLEVGAATWESAEFRVRPMLVPTRAVFSADAAGPFVGGEVKNMGAITAATVRIVAIAKDSNAFPLFAAQTLLHDISGGSSQPFTIRFPRDPGIRQRAASNGLELIIEAQ